MGLSSTTLNPPSLDAFIKLTEMFCNKVNQASIDALLNQMEKMQNEINSLKSTNAYELSEAINMLANALKAQGAPVLSLEPSWEDIMNSIRRVPKKRFLYSSKYEPSTYSLPKGYVSWGDNIAYAYSIATKMQDTINQTGGIASKIHVGVDGKNVYKGFCMMEYHIGSYTTVGDSMSLSLTNSDANGNYADAYLLGLKEGSESESLIEWEEGDATTKDITFSYTELPEDGRFFLFALFFDDEYSCTIRNSSVGKLLIIGGHPISIKTLENCRFDEGIIQLNRTGEQIGDVLPSEIIDAQENNKMFICVADTLEEETGLTFRGELYDSSDNLIQNGDSTVWILPFTNDFNINKPDITTHFWYIIFDSNVTKFKNFSIYDRYHILKESEYDTTLDPPVELELKSYQLIIDNDGMDVELGKYDHPGTNYNFYRPIVNDIYLRQARGAFNTNGRNDIRYDVIDKIHMPELVEHGLAVDESTTDSAYIVQNESDLYELELPALKKVTAGGVVSTCNKLHELVLPSLETNNGTIAASCSNLYRLSLPNLKTSTGTIANGCSKLTELELPELETASYGGILLENIGCMPNAPILTICGKITSNAYGTFTLYNLITAYRGDNDWLFYFKNADTIYLPNFEYIDYIGNCTAIGGPNLEKFIAPKFRAINRTAGWPTLFNTPNIKYVSIGQPNGIMQQASTSQYLFSKNNNLIKVELRLTQNTKLAYWNPINAFTFDTSLVEDLFCHNNIEQFLYNFRTCIIDNLINRNETSKLTITLHQNVFNIVNGLDETSYASTFHMPNEDIDYVTSLNNKLSEINWGLAYA